MNGFPGMSFYLAEHRLLVGTFTPKTYLKMTSIYVVPTNKMNLESKPPKFKN